jgi:hypothetical protein
MVNQKITLAWMMYILLATSLEINSKITPPSLPKMKRMTRNTNKSKLQLDLVDFKSILKKELLSMTSNLLKDLNIGSQTRVLQESGSKSLNIGELISDPNDFSDDEVYCIQSVSSPHSFGKLMYGVPTAMAGTKCTRLSQVKIIRIGETNEYKIKELTRDYFLTYLGRHGFWPIQFYSLYKNSWIKWRFTYRNETDKENSQMQIVCSYNNFALAVYNNKGFTAVNKDSNELSLKFNIYRMTDEELLPWDIGYVVQDVEDFFDEGIYCIAAMNSGKALGLYKKTHNNQIFQAGKICTPEFTYRVLKTPSGAFKLENQSGKGYLTENLIGQHLGPVCLADWKDKLTQKWKIENFGNKEFQLFSSASGFPMDVDGGMSLDGRGIITYFINQKRKNQRFRFTLVDVKDMANSA